MAAHVHVTRPLLTVLTSPIPATAARVYGRLRRAAGAVVNPRRRPPAPNRYPGHFALVRSVVEGLRAIGADFNFNPARTAEVGAVVYAPANEALLQAAALKRDGHVWALMAGPTNAFLPDEHDGVLLMPEIDVVLVASEWVRQLYASEVPDIAAKLRVCQAGIDSDDWQPTTQRRSNRALVYWKDAPEGLRHDAERVLNEQGLQCRVLRYGSYDAATFKACLDEAALAVFLSTFETQGLALAEAWAMNVPTLVWNPQARTQWQGGRTFVAGSSAPFLTPATGRTWKTLEQLASAVRDVLASPESFTPREWVLANMTDAICARALSRIVQKAAVQGPSLGISPVA
jgi:hypothetical protein